MAFEFATFLPSIGSILYLAFAVLFIKELIGLVSSIGGGSGNKGGSVGDKVSGAWDWMKNKNKERIANNEIEAKKRQDELAKEKADSEAVGRYKANMDIKSQQAAQVLSEGTQKLQEFIQNPEYHTYAKDLNEKIVVKMDSAAHAYESIKTNIFHAISNEFTLLKQFDKAILANKKNAQDMINGNNTAIADITRKDKEAKNKLPGVVKNIPIIEKKLKDLEKNLETEGKKPKPDKRKIAGWTKSLNSNKVKLDQLKKDEASFNKIINEAQATLKIYQDATIILNQKVVALDELLANFKGVQLPEEQHLKMTERNILTLAQNLKKEVGELHKNFEELAKLNIKKVANAQNVGTYKQRIEDSLNHVVIILQKLQEIEQDEMTLSKAVLQDGKQFQESLININKQAEQSLISLNFWNSSPSGTPKL